MDQPVDTRPPATAHAVALVVAASMLFAATSLMAKRLGLDTEAEPGLNPIVIAAGRFVFAFVTILTIVPLTRRSGPLITAELPWKFYLIRVVFGWLGVTFLFAAVLHMPVADATAISFLNPLITMALAVVLLGERITQRKYIAAVLAVTGALLILKPGTDAFKMAGLLALAAAFCIAFEVIIIKRLSETEPTVRFLLISNAIGSVLSMFVASFFWSWPTALQWMLLLLLGIVMISGQFFFIQAMKRGEASVVTPALYTVLVFAAFYDFLFYGVVPTWEAVVGAGLIVAGATTLVLRSADA